eukprot:s6522_g2.t1
MFAAEKPSEVRPKCPRSDEGPQISANEPRHEMPEPPGIALEDHKNQGNDEILDAPNVDPSHQSNQVELDVKPTENTGEPTSGTPCSWEENGPRFKALPKEEQAMLRRAHQNLCHPSADQLSAVLRNQGCRPELFQAVYDMKCSTCAASQKPRIARPSTFKDALDFNDKVFVDGITWTSKAGISFHFYHFLDQATNFHVAIPAPSRTAEQAILKVSEAWFNWAGPPNTLVMDSATEFTSELFQEFLQRHDVKDVVTSPHAHWQNGRCERHGQVLQNMLNRLDVDQPISSFQDLQQALIQCTRAKNSLSIRKGYSPEVLVFGKSSKLPGSITSSDEMPAHASASREDAHGIEFRQKLALRERARVAFHQADNDAALRRACLRRTRPDRQGYSPGEWVMMYQPQPNQEGYWFGPLKVVQQESNLSVWATKGGRLHRRAPEHVRPVCAAEARQIPSEEVLREPDSATNIPDMSLPDTSEIPVTEIPQPVIPPDNLPEDNSSQSQDQPDTEPENNNPEDFNPSNSVPNYIDTPVPELDADDDLVTTHLLCCDDEILMVDPAETPCAWRFEVELPRHLDPEVCKDVLLMKFCLPLQKNDKGLK